MPSSFLDEAGPPDDAALARVLGEAAGAWRVIVTRVDAQPGLARAWTFYGAKHGWQLRVGKGKRSVLYLIPGHDRFTASLALSEAGLDALRAERFPADLARAIEREKVVREGRPARIEVTGPDDAELALRLLAIKLRT